MSPRQTSRAAPMPLLDRVFLTGCTAVFLALIGCAIVTLHSNILN
jgi:hypothetical protein